MTIKKVIFASLLFLGLTSFTVQKEEKNNFYKLQKIEFDGHTYILLIDGWNHAGNYLLHDPSCDCIKKALEKMEEKKWK